MASSNDVTILLERLRSSTDSNDKLEAIESLVDLSETVPIEVGHGIPILIENLKLCATGKLEGDAAGSILEILENLVSGDVDTKKISAAANTARLVDTHENIVVLFDILETAEVSTACSAVEILRILHRNSAPSLEATVLECPAGMQRLLDILASHYDDNKFDDDEREPLRNVTIELWEQLTGTNADMQTFLALQEGFDHLAAIMYGERNCGPIVRDCLAITKNVAGLSSTQTLLTHSQLLKQFEAIFKFEFHEESILPFVSNSDDQSLRKQTRSVTDGQADAKKSNEKSSGMWSDEDEDDEGQNDLSDGEVDPSSRSSTTVGYSAQDVCWMESLSSDQLKCCELAAGILLKLVTLNVSTSPSQAVEADDEMKAILAMREENEKNKHREVVWNLLGKLMIQLSLPPPPPPFSFIAFTPTLLWKSFLVILKECGKNQNLLVQQMSSVFISEPHVLAVQLPKLRPRHDDELLNSAAPFTPGNGGGGRARSASSHGGPGQQLVEGPLTAMGCAVRWLLHGHEVAKQSIAASSLTNGFGSPNKVIKFLKKKYEILSQINHHETNRQSSPELTSKYQQFLTSDENVLFLSILNEADLGAVDMLGGLFELVESCLNDEATCMIAINSAVMPDMTMMFSPMMDFDGSMSEDASNHSSPPQPFVNILLQSLALSVDACLFDDSQENDGLDVAVASSISPDAGERGEAEEEWIYGKALKTHASRNKVRQASRSGSASARLLRVVFSKGGEGAKQLGLRAPVQTRDFESGDVYEKPLLAAILFWIENLVAGIHTQLHQMNREQNTKTKTNMDESLSRTNSESLVSKTLGLVELTISLLSLLSVWLHECPLAVAQMLEKPENLFLIEISSNSNPFPTIKTSKLKGAKVGNNKKDGFATDLNTSSPMSDKSEESTELDDLQCLVKSLPLIQRMSTMVLGVMLEETANGEEKRKLEMEKRREKELNNMKAARRLRSNGEEGEENPSETNADVDDASVDALSSKPEVQAVAGDTAVAEKEQEDEEEWNSENLQRCIVGRVGFGPFQRSLTLLLKSFLLEEAYSHPNSVCGGGFSTFLKERVPSVQSSLVKAYRKQGGVGNIEDMENGISAEELKKLRESQVRLQTAQEELNLLKSFIQSQGLKFPSNGEMKDEHVSKIDVIHAVGPDLRKGFKHIELVKSTSASSINDEVQGEVQGDEEVEEEVEQEILHTDDAVEHLTNAYRNIFSEFLKSETDLLRMLPVSGGIFSGSFKDDMHLLTRESIKKAFQSLTVEEQSNLSRKQVDLCIFSENELDLFQSAGFNLRSEQDTSSTSLGRSDSLVENTDGQDSLSEEFSVKLQPFGVLGIQMTNEGGFIQKGQDPKKLISCCIVDPAGLHHIQPPGGPSGAGGAAGAIYKWLGISDETHFTQDVIEAVKQTGDAKHHAYVSQFVGDIQSKEASSSSSLLNSEERTKLEEQIATEKKVNTDLTAKLQTLSERCTCLEEENIEYKNQIDNFKDSSKAVQIAKEMGIKEGIEQERQKSDERIEKYKKRVKDCEQLISQSSEAASRAAAAWHSQKVEMENAWDEERRHMQQLLQGSANNDEYETFKQKEQLMKEEISTLKTTLEALQEKLVERESDGFDRDHASRLAMEQAAKHQEELERAVQAQVSASADALQAETEALEKIKQMELKHKKELDEVQSQLNGMRSVLAEKDNDLSESNENNNHLESVVSELESNIRSMEDELKEKSSALQERIELSTSSELERESLGQEVKSALEERDRLRQEVSELENKLKENVREKEASQQAYAELEVELTKLRDSATNIRRQHTQDQDAWSSEKNDLLNKLSEFEAETAALSHKLQAQKETYDQFKLANENEHSKLVSNHQRQVDSLKEELSIMKSDFDDYKNTSQSSEDLGIVGKEVASKESLLKLQSLLDTAIEQRNNATERAAKLETEATEERRAAMSREEELKMKIADTTSELQSMISKNKSHEARLKEEEARRKEEYEADLDAVTSVSNAEKLKVKALRREMESMASNHESKLNTLKEKYEMECAQWKSKVSEIEDEIVKIRGRTSEELMSIKADHAAAVRLMEEDHRIAIEQMESEHQSEVSQLRSGRNDLQNTMLEADLEKEELEDRIRAMESEFEDMKEDMAAQYGEEIGKLKVELMKATSEANSSAEHSREELAKVLANQSKLSQSQKEEMESLKQFYEQLLENEKLKNKESMMNLMETSSSEIDTCEQKAKIEFEDWKEKFEKEKKKQFEQLEHQFEKDKEVLENKLSKQLDENRNLISKFEGMLEEEHRQFLDSEELAKKSVARASELTEKLKQVEASHAKFKERIAAETSGRDEASFELAESTAKAEAEVIYLTQEVEKLKKLLALNKEKEMSSKLEQYDMNNSASSVGVGTLLTSTRTLHTTLSSSSPVSSIGMSGQSFDVVNGKSGQGVADGESEEADDGAAQGVLLTSEARSNFSRVDIEHEIEEALMKERQKYELQFNNNVKEVEKEFYHHGKMDGLKIGREEGYKEGMEEGEKLGFRRGKLVGAEESEIEKQQVARKDLNARLDMLNAKHEQSLNDVKMELKKAHEIVVTELESEVSNLRSELSDLRQLNHLEEAKRQKQHIMSPQPSSLSASRKVMFSDGDNREEVAQQQSSEEDVDDFQIHSNSYMMNHASSSTTPFTPMSGANGMNRRMQHHVATPDLRYGLDEERRLYRELEEEHEDLLSLLAQQEIEKEMITQGLLKLSGGNAQPLLEAKKQAEEECLSKFGVYIPANHDASEGGSELGSPIEEGVQMERGDLMSPSAIRNSENLFGNDDNYDEFEDDLKDL